MHEAFISYDGADGANYRLGYFINTISDAIVINSLFSQVRIFPGLESMGLN